MAVAIIGDWKAARYALYALYSEEAAEMPGPADEMAPGAEGRSRLRASDADRDQVVDVLKAAFVQGLLAKDEFGLRVGQVLVARTYADLDALTASIPAGLTPQGPPAAAMAVQSHRRNLVAGKTPASPSDRRTAPQFILVARMIRTRRQLIFLVAGMLLLVGGMMLPSTVAFISGMLVVGLSAPQALPWTPTSAMVRTWQWLYRHQAGPL